MRRVNVDIGGTFTDCFLAFDHQHVESKPPKSGAVDDAATEQARQAERESRKRRGKPDHEFVKEWETPKPPREVPFHGSWKNVFLLYRGSPDDPCRKTRSVYPGSMPHIRGRWQAPSKGDKGHCGTLAPLAGIVATQYQNCRKIR